MCLFNDAMPNSRSRSTLISLTVHAAGISLLLLLSKQVRLTIPEISLRVLHLSDPSPVNTPMPVSTLTTGGGGGGMHETAPPSAGHLPKTALRQFVPPTVAIVNPEPKLAMEMSMEGPPELDKTIPQLGDPLSRFGSASSGMGGPLGIGNGRGTGAGNGAEASSGDGDQGSGTVYRAGSGVTAPILIHRVEPEFSEEARKSKYSGTVVIRAEIDPNGRPRNLHLSRSLGQGLDEKGLAAVSQWVFRPGTREGKPVTVSALIEVTFHLL
jgi:TonB family protein